MLTLIHPTGRGFDKTKSEYKNFCVGNKAR
jgi:hypothetical protein